MFFDETALCIHCPSLGSGEGLLALLDCAKAAYKRLRSPYYSLSIA